MKHFKATIKEKGGAICTPEYFGDDYTTIEFLEKFWGLNNDDVEWAEIIECNDV